MGVVYRANHRVTGERVAVKTVLRTSGSTLASLRQEVRALGEIHHPGIIRIVDHELTSAQPWYAMELMEGLTLRQVIERYWGTEGRSSSFTVTPTRKPDTSQSDSAPWKSSEMPGAPLLKLVRRLCTALAWLHGLGLIHRDSNPPTSSSGGTEASSWETSAWRPSSEAPTDARYSRWTAVAWARPSTWRPSRFAEIRGCPGGPLLARLHPL